MKVFIFIKYFFAVLVSVSLMPGLGHFLVGKIKKGLILIGITLLVIMIMSFIIASSPGLAALPKEYSVLKNYIDVFLSKDSAEVTAIMISRAAILAYSIADLVFSFIYEIKNKGVKNENNKNK